MKAPNLSLSQRVLLLIAVALLPALAILGFNEFTLRKAREAEVHDYALRMSEMASFEMERLMTGAAALLIAVANAPVVAADDRALCDDYMDRLSALLPQINLINVTDLEGQSQCATSGRPDDLRPGLSASLRERLADQAFAVGEYVDIASGPALLVGAQRTAADGINQGFVISAIGLDYLGDVLRERELDPDGAMTIADRTGRIIAREPFPEQYVGEMIPDSYQDRVMAAQPGTMQVTSRDGTERIMGYQPATKPLGLYVSAGTSVSASLAPINQATMRGLLLAATGGLVAVLLALWFGRHFIRRPIWRLINTIRAWRGGDHAARTGIGPGRAEFYQVGQAIDGLLDELGRRQAAQAAAEQHRDLLARELDHRIKNLLATVQALARQSFRASNIDPAALQAFYGRLAVMADAHKLLTAERSESAEIAAVISTAIGPFVDEDDARFRLSGPDVSLHAKAALSLAMALHELCTNAAKYGALSTATGQISLSWTMMEGRQLALTWRESGGPAVALPSSKGFGSRMIERALAADLGATVQFDYAPDGLVCTIIAAETALAGQQVLGAGPFKPILAMQQQP